jgi:transposase InsO family protein
MFGVDPTHAAKQLLTVPVTLKSQGQAARKVFAALDTMAEVSTISLTLAKQLHVLGEVRAPGPNEPAVLGTFDANTTVPRIGTVQLTLDCGKKSVVHEFEVIAGRDNEMLLGIDLFHKLNFYVGNVPTSWPASQPGKLNALEAEEANENLRERRSPWSVEDEAPKAQFDWLQQHVEVLVTENENIDEASVACESVPESVMHLPLNVEASWRHQYQTPAAAREALDDTVANWAKKHHIEDGNPDSDFNSAMLAVGKKDLSGEKTKWRICLDTRHINAALQQNYSHARERMPHLHEALSQVQGFKFASSIDLRDAYQLFPVAEEDRDKLSFTHKGKKWRFARWPFGLSPATAKFQKVMETVFAGLVDSVEVRGELDERPEGSPRGCGIVIWMDDLLIHSSGSMEEHGALVAEVLRRLNEHNLRINRKKCHFGYKRVLLLGHCLSGEGREVDPLKASQALKWPKLNGGKSVERFLGFTNFVRDYIPNYAQLSAHLEKLKKQKVFELDDLPEAKAAFESLQLAINSSPVLSTPDPRLPFQVATDASQFGVGAILYQQENETAPRKFIAFASASLKGAQKNYGATKRELLGVIVALQAFHNYLYGAHFVLYTDHKALTALFTSHRLSYVLESWLDTLLQYDFEVRHLMGVLNILPDHLSRLYEFLDVDQVHGDAGSTASAVAPKHVKEVSMGPEREQPQHKPSLPISIDELTAYPDRELAQFIAERHLKQALPKDQQIEYLRVRHTTDGHYGAESLYKSSWHDGYFWPGMRKQCSDIVTQCRSCLEYNVGRQGFHPVRSLRAENAGDHVAVDSCGPFPVSGGGSQYILIMVDVKSRYLITRALPNLTMESMARALYETFAVFGPPKILQSDNGTEYINKLVQELMIQAGVDFRQVLPFNPRANGLAERYVKAVKDCLKKKLEGNFADWDLALPGVTSAINLHESSLTKTAPFTFFFGRQANAWQDFEIASVLGPEYSEILEEVDQHHQESEVRLGAAADMLARKQVFQGVVAPIIQGKANERQQVANNKLDVSRNSVFRELPKGATVFKWNHEAVSKLEPLFTGPFYVHRKSETSGAYYLKDSDGTKLPRALPITQLKWVSDSTASLFSGTGEEIAAADQRGVVKSILKTRSKHGQTFYLVEWKAKGEANEWLPASAFDDRSLLVTFHREQSKLVKKQKKRYLEGSKEESLPKKAKKTKSYAAAPEGFEEKKSYAAAPEGFEEKKSYAAVPEGFEKKKSYAAAPEGFEIIQDFYERGHEVKVGLRILYKWDSPNGWFLASVKSSTGAFSKERANRLNWNVSYKKTETASQINGVVASQLVESTYGKAWVALRVLPKK